MSISLSPLRSGRYALQRFNACMLQHAASDFHCSAVQLAYQRGMITLGERERVFKVMTNLGLKLWDDVCDDHEMLWQVWHMYNMSTSRWPASAS